LVGSRSTRKTRRARNFGKSSRSTYLQRRLLLEPLECRHLLAAILFDPGDYLGQYNTGAGYVTGSSAIELDEGAHSVAVYGVGAIDFSVDELGGVTSADTTVAVAIDTDGDSVNVTLQFNNAQITTDPADYLGAHYVQTAGGQILGGGTGLQSAVIIPGFSYTVLVNGVGYSDFDVDAAGNVTSQNAAAVGTDTDGDQIDETLQFINTKEISVDPADFVGSYNVQAAGHNVLGAGTGVQSAVVIPGYSYRVLVNGVGYSDFDVDSDGNVTSQNTAAAFGADVDGDQIDETLRFNNAQIMIDPGDYTGTYYVEGGSLLPSTTGTAGVIVVPGMDHYTLSVSGVGSYDFSVDDNGEPVPSSIDVDVSGAIYTFLLSQVTHVNIDPQGFTGSYMIFGGPSEWLTGYQTLELDPGTYTIDLAGTGTATDITFDVNSGHIVTSQDPSRAVAYGNSLTFNNQTITINPAAYEGQYLVSGGVTTGTSGWWSSGVLDVVVVPDMQDYSVLFFGPSPTITFDVDADGNVTSDRPTSATAPAAQILFTIGDHFEGLHIQRGRSR